MCMNVAFPLSLNSPVGLLINLALRRLMFHYVLRYGCYSPIVAFSLSISFYSRSSLFMRQKMQACDVHSMRN